MAIFNLTNYYCNVSQYNEELLVDGVLFAYPIGSYLYLLTTTGIFRYMFNKQADKSDYGVWNRDISYISYEIPAAAYQPCPLMNFLGFVNRNGVFCILVADSGELKKVYSWNFPVGNVSKVNIWGFVNELGNACFVVGSVLFDVTLRDKDNIVGLLGQIALAGFIKFDDNDQQHELVVLKASVGNPLQGNFSEGLMSFSGMVINKADYGVTFYVRTMPYDGDTAHILPKETAFALLAKHFYIEDGSDTQQILLQNQGVYNTNINVAVTNLSRVTGFFVMGFANIGVNLPILLNKLPQMVSVPKLSVGFSSLFISDFVRYLSSSKTILPQFKLLVSANDQEIEKVLNLRVDAGLGQSASHFVEISTGNITGTSVKFKIRLEQSVLVGSSMQPVAITDGFYMNPIQLVYAPSAR